MAAIEDRLLPVDRTAPPYTGPRKISVRVGRWADRILVVCLASIGLLLVCDVVLNWMEVYDDSRIERLFNIAREQNIPTWFASTQAVCTGVTAFLIAMVLRMRGVSRLRLVPWMVFAAFFVFVGVDDVATIHERLGSVAKDHWVEAQALANGGEKPELASFGWQFFVAPAFALMGLWMFVYLWRRFRSFGLRRFLFAGLAFWALAVAFDYVEGIPGVFEISALSLGIERVYDVSHPWRLAEETMEMVGTALLWYGLLQYLAHAAHGFRITIVGPPAEGWRLTPRPAVTETQESAATDGAQPDAQPAPASAPAAHPRRTREHQPVS